MRMAVKIERPSAHVIPRPKGVMAQNEELSIQSEFGIVLNAGPQRTAQRIGTVIVADDQMLSAIEQAEQFRDMSGLATGEVTQMPDDVLRPDMSVPAHDQTCIMLGYACERPLIDSQNARIAKMRVGREKNSHDFPSIFGCRKSSQLRIPKFSRGAE